MIKPTCASQIPLSQYTRFYSMQADREGSKEGALILADKVIEFKFEDAISVAVAIDNLAETQSIVWKVPKKETYFVDCSGIKDKKTIKEAINAYRRALKLYEEQLEFVANDPAARLEEELKVHNWDFIYSDIPKVVVEGRERQKRIEEMMKKVPKRKLKSLMKKYIPEDALLKAG